MKLPIVGPAYMSRSMAVSAQECVNLYAESVEQGGRAESVLYGTPGQVLVASLGSGPIRGMRVMGGILYVVSGNFLYSLTSAGVSVSLGQIIGSATVSMAHSFDSPPDILHGPSQLCIVNGAQGYIYDTVNGLSQIVDPDFNASDVVVFMDGYFIFHWVGTHTFFTSVLYDGTQYLPTDIGEKLTDASNIIGLARNHKELWVFGGTAIEVWFNEGLGASFAFTQIESAYVERGCGAALSIVNLDNTLFWLGDDLIVYRAEGYSAIRVSTHAIEAEIKKYPFTRDAHAFKYTDEGHKFYVLTFPTGSTWVFDVSTGMWHERRTFGLNRWAVNAYAFFDNKHYVGDVVNGNVYLLDLDAYTDNGLLIQRRRATTYMHSESDPVGIDWLQLVVESGAGLTVGQGSDPQVMLQYSDDSGKTWSNEKWRTMGKIGEYSRRVRWTRLGRFYQRIFRIVITDPIKIAIIELDLGLSKDSR